MRSSLRDAILTVKLSYWYDSIPFAPTWLCIFLVERLNTLCDFNQFILGLSGHGGNACLFSTLNQTRKFWLSMVASQNSHCIP